MVQKVKPSSENTSNKAIWMGQKWIFNTLFLLIQTVDWFKIFLTWVKNNLDQSKKNLNLSKIVLNQ